jgi:RNA polymerase-binding transcription factor DksA
MGTLTEEQNKLYGQRLRQQAEDLRKTIHAELIKSDNEQYVKLAEQVHDTGDESIADLLSDVDIIMIDREINELRATEIALEKLATGTYGTCDDCGGEIEPARLDAQLQAGRCLQCQRQYEKTHAGEAHPSL